MKPIPDCVPDALSMIIMTARAVSEDDFIHRKVLLKVMGALAEEGDLGAHPADVYLNCWEIACRALGVKDPLENEKARGNKTALGVLKVLSEKMPTGGDPLKTALRVSFAGTMLDFNGLGRSDLQEKIADYFSASPALDESEALLAAIRKAESVMLVANRAGEITMDRPLVEAMADMGKTVYLAVSATPVFVMATEKDVVNSAYSDRACVVNPGTAMFGLLEERASSSFQSTFNSVDVVIVKGGTHFNTMTTKRDVYFILKGSQPEDAERLNITINGGAIVKIAAGS